MKVSIQTPSQQDASNVVEMLKDPINAVDAAQATGNTVDAVVNKDVDAALELLAQIVTAQPQYIGLGLESPLADALKQTADILRNRGKQIDEAVDGVVDPYNRARTPQPRDPLAIDLDGDGLETVAANGYSGAMFDMNSDGIKVATGWVNSDDGILVWDKNRNNMADNGAELFGRNDATTNAAAMAEGLNYLRDLDSNTDGKISNLDTAFADLRVWRDLNGDGTSQTGELLTLDQAGIASLSTAFTTQDINLNNGNRQISAGSYTRTDGSTGATGDLLLQQQTIYSRFSDRVALTDDALALPGLQGMGAVRGLREAVSLDATGNLADVLAQYSAATTRDAQQTILDEFIQIWGATSTMSTSISVNRAVAARPWGYEGIVNLMETTAVEQYAKYHPAEYAKITTLERFIGSNIIDLNVVGWVVVNHSSGATVVFSAEQLALLDQSYEALRDYVYQGLLMQTRLRPYDDAVTINLSSSGFSFDFSGMEQLFKSKIQADPANGLIDLIDYTRAAGPVYGSVGWDYAGFLRGELTAVDLTAVGPALQVAIADGSGASLGSSNDAIELFIGSVAGETITGDKQNDVMVGNGGNDYLYGRQGDDILFGDSGNDQLHGEDGRDALFGGNGNDHLHAGAGNDTLDGGAGNDHLSGGAGADIYLFGRGSGQDTVDNSDSDALSVNADTIQLGAGIAPTGVTLTRSGDALIISINGTDDSLRVQSYFQQDGASSYGVESIVFADGTRWDLATVKARVLTATVANDTFTGYATNDTINGGDGNDTLHGQAGDDVLDGGTGADNLSGGDGNDTVRGNNGNDTLYGGNGNDTLQGGANNDHLYAGAGNDTLQGGTGNDHLSGGAGADIYLFGSGSGQDTVDNSDSDALGVNADTIQLGAGIAPTGVTLTRSGDALIISINGTDDSLRVQSYFQQDGASSYGLENIRFADGTVWDYATAKGKLTTVTQPVGMTVSGTAADETLVGGLGNDSINGSSGNDTLDGGAGNDTLDGGSGNDTYLFGRGAGKDTISAHDGTVGKVDVIQLGAGVLTSDVVLSRDSSTLVLSIKGSSDSLRVNSYFASDATAGYQVEQITFADGTVWDVAAVRAMTMAGSSENDTLIGYATADTLSGLAGDDTLAGRAGNDTLDGGAGEDTLSGEEGDDLLRGGTQNDRLYGGTGTDTLQGQAGDDALYGDAGNDTLDGGAGNDTLDGGSGNDTYLFGRGAGKDTISAHDGTLGKVDVIRLGAGVLTSDVVLSRDSSTLVLSIKGSSDSLRVSSYFTSDATGGHKVEQITFADGTVWDVATVRTMTMAGSSENDTLLGYATADTLSGLAGDDTLSGRAGNDTLDGGAGEDALFGEDGDDMLRGGTQNDVLYGGTGTDTLQGQAGDDILYGDAGNDILDGGAGKDRLQGGAGSDLYQFRSGDGQDVIDNYDVTAGRVDRLVLESFTAADVVTWRKGSDLVIAHVDSADQVTVSNHFYTESPGVTPYRIDQVSFSNGVVWDTAALARNAASLTSGNDVFQGGGGNDTINALAGNDTITGGKGNDVLDGGIGNDTYKFAVGSGVDRISDYDITAGNIDVIEFVDVASTALLGLERSGSDLLIKYGANDQLTIQSCFSGNAHFIEQFRFSDGVVWDEALIKANVVTRGTAGNDFISGYSGGANNIYALEGADTVYGGDRSDLIDGGAGNDTLLGHAGNDTLLGHAGNDTLTGGVGNDSMEGGVGNDSYRFARGDGSDTIAENDTTAGNSDTIRFVGVASGDITAVERVSNDLILRYGVTDQVRVQGFFGSTANRVEQVTFSNGVTWVESDLMTRVVVNGTANNDALWGLNGMSNAMYGHEGADTLYGGNMADTLHGGAGNDTLVGYAGNDTLIGGVGNDYMEGGVGNDSYQFARGDGSDTIAENDTTAGNSDTVLFGADIASNQIWFSKSGSNLVASIVGTSDKVTINSWYSGAAHQTERFQLASGAVLLNSQVEQLVSAMAAFTPPPVGETSLTATQQTALTPVLTAVWQTQS